MRLELSDEDSLRLNKVETYTPQVIRTGDIDNSGISLHYLEDGNILISCRVDENSEYILLTPETRLPQSTTREKMVKDGLDFLFNSLDGSPGSWPYCERIDDDDNKISYHNSHQFVDNYTENPPRQMMGREMRLVIYRDGNKEQNGIAIIEYGNQLNTHSGVISYYSFRTIPPADVNWLP